MNLSKEDLEKVRASIVELYQEYSPGRCPIGADPCPTCLKQDGIRSRAQEAMRILGAKAE